MYPTAPLNRFSTRSYTVVFAPCSKFAQVTFYLPTYLQVGMQKWTVYVSLPL